MNKLFVGALLCTLLAAGCKCGEGPPPISIGTLRPSVSIERTDGVVADGVDVATVIVTVLSQEGKPVPGVAVTVSATGENNTLTEPGTTDSQGVARGSIASTRAEVKTLTLGLKLNSDSRELEEKPTVRFVHGPASGLAFGVHPGSTQVGANIAPAVQVLLQDAHGNLVTSGAKEISLALDANAQGATLSGTTVATTSAGIASFPELRVGKVGTGYTLIASATGLGSTSSAPFDITVFGAPSQLAFVGQPSNALAGATLSPAIQLELRDSEGNLVTSANAPVSIALSNPNGAILSGTTTVAAVNGVARFSDLSINKVGTGYTLAASATGCQGAVSTAFDIAHNAPDRAASQLSAMPATAVADGAEQVALRLVVKDAQGNAVPDQAVSLSATGTGNTLSPSSGTTDASGVFTATLVSTRAEAKTVTATAGAASLTASVTFTPGAPSGAHSTLVASPSRLALGSSTTLTVTVLDANNNPVPGVAVSLSASGSSNVFTPSPPEGTTNASGVYSASLTSSTQETKTVTALVHAGAFALTANVTFGCKVLILGDDQTTGTENVSNALQSAGLTPTLVANGSINYAGTPAASDFQAVLVLVGNNYQTDMPLDGQSNVVNANTAGTGVVLLEWAAYHAQNNRWTTLKNLLLLERSNGAQGKLTFTLESPGHPIWAGLPTSFTTVYSLGANIGNTLLNGGVRIAGCTECASTGVVVKDATGRIVQIAHAGNYNTAFTNSAATWKNDTNTTQMLVNAVKWAGRCQ